MIRKPLPQLLLAVAILALAVSSCTIVHHDDKQQTEGDELSIYFDNGSFDAMTYVDSIWEAQVLPRIEEEAVNLSSLMEALANDENQAITDYGYRIEVTAPFNFMVRGKARIAAANLESAAATISLDVLDPAGNPVEIQIGPVVKGTAIRDSMDFISFEEFTNQLEFANVSREMNNRIKAEILESIDREALEGEPVEFLGAFQWRAGKPVLITPVKLTVGVAE